LAIKKDQSGFTLIEVVVAVVIISIILLGFFMFFLNASKTTKTSTEIFDAIYYAQREMERIYQLSQSFEFDNREVAITEPPVVEGETTPQVEAKKAYYYSKTGENTFEKLGDAGVDSNDYYYYQLLCIPQNYNLTKVVVNVYDQKGGVLKAKMESVYEWR